MPSAGERVAWFLSVVRCRKRGWSEDGAQLHEYRISGSVGDGREAAARRIIGAMEAGVLTSEESRVRLRAGLISLVVSVVLLGAKYQAYLLTGSTAILSDALESIVNVVAAVFALGGLVFAGRPADRNHPYGHGKIEFFSAAFEGGLIAFAAVVIIYEVVQSLIRGGEIRRLEWGLVIVLVAGLVNLLLLVLAETGIMPLGWPWLVIFGTVGTMGLSVILAPLLDRRLARGPSSA